MGVVLGVSWLPEAKKVEYTTAAMGPLLDQTEAGVDHLVSLFQQHAAAHGGAVDTSSWSGGMVDEVAAWLVRVINAIAHISKGLGPVAGIEPLAALLERALGCAVRAVSILPHHPYVRNRAVFLFNKMVDGLEARLLNHMLIPSSADESSPPTGILPILLSAPSPDHMVQSLNFLTTLMNRQKATAGPVIAASFTQTCAKIFELMPPPPPLLPASAAAASAAARTMALAASGGAGAVAVGVTNGEAEARTELQRAYAFYLQSMVAHGLATGVMTSGDNAGSIDSVLNSFSAVITALTDISIARVLLNTCAGLVRAWLPISPPTAPSPSPVSTATGTLTPAVKTPTSGAGGLWSQPVIVAGGVALEGYAIPAPTPLPDEGIYRSFASFCLEQLPKTPLSLALAPGLGETDPQSHTALSEGAVLLLTLAIHVAAHSPVMGAQASPMDVLTHMVTVVLPSLGLSQAACTGIGAALANSLRMGAPECYKDPSLKGALGAAAMELRTAALAAVAASAGGES